MMHYVGVSIYIIIAPLHHGMTIYHIIQSGVAINIARCLLLSLNGETPFLPRTLYVGN